MKSIVRLLVVGMATAVSCVVGVVSDRPAYAKPASHGANAITLASLGKSDYVIAVSDNAIASEQTAAKELQNTLQQISGVLIPIQTESQTPVNHPQILIGAGKRARRLAPIDWDSLGFDGIVIKSVGKDLILAGGRPRGTLYAVDTFLEDDLGVRWWASGETTIPQESTIRVAPQNTVYVPPLKYREVFASQAAQDPELATHLKLNGNFETQGPDLGGHYSILGWCHTIEQLLPLDKYFHDHPEWFSDPANGNKPCTAASPMPPVGTWQLNLADDQARIQLTKNALDWIRANPDAGMISISQNDNSNECVTPQEQAMAEHEGSPSGPMLHFVNAVAADIGKQYPNFLVETLAYVYTRKPPKFERPGPNVVIRLCSIEGDFSHPFNSPVNQNFSDDLEGWKAIAPRLFVWNYVTNFSNVLLPFPNMDTLGPNIQYFAANNTIGLFEEGDNYSGGTGDFDAMRSWIMAHMMWNPNRDPKELEAEFMNGYFGPAAPYLQRYVDRIQQAYLATGEPLPCEQTKLTYLTLDVMNQSMRDFALAQKAVAGDPVHARRVQREQLALDDAWLLRYKALRDVATQSGVTLEGPTDPLAFATQYVQMARSFNVKFEGEIERFDPYADHLIGMMQPPPPLPDFLQNTPANDVVDCSAYSFSLFDAQVVNDPIASGGYAAELPGNTSIWGIQFPLTDHRLSSGKWHCYILARIDAQNPNASGPALIYGVYDNKTNTGVIGGTVDQASFLPDKYIQIDLGVHAWSSSMYLWVAPPNRKDIKAIYVARALFVREAY